MSFLDFTLLDFLDILLVAFLLYQLYRLIKDTVAINVLIGVAAIYIVWKLVEALGMELLSEILGKFIGVGVIALVIVFQQEIRKFLLVIGSTNFRQRRKLLKQLRWLSEDDQPLVLDELITACAHMSQSKTGALIVIEKDGKLGSFRDTGTLINSRISSRLIESIFNKHSPLHDGAVILSGNLLVAAGCILPITEKRSLPKRFGLRHRAALGVTEKTNALAIVVSEETGEISLASNDELQGKLKSSDLQHLLTEKLKG